MSAAENRAVFLSYASQDADAARRICDALRAAGVEVWFDQSELRGGDAWDAKIRKQIATCALFVPIISANSQARLEGYFRLEWKLAAQRTHTMADAKPFLLPVVIDITHDAGAHVPEEFRAVQWTRLPGGETSAAFCQRVKMLLGCGDLAFASSDVGAPLAGARGSPPPTGRQQAASLQNRARRWLAPAVFAVAALGALAFWQPWKRAATTGTAKSVAVIPFENRSPQPDSEFFADGVHEDLLASLSYVRDITVIPRMVMMHYRATKLRPRDLGAELRVAYVMTGSVRRSGNSVRVTGELIETQTEQSRWTWQRDYDLAAARDVMAIQREMAQAIAGELKAAITPQAQKLIARRPTESVEAYDAYVKARTLRTDAASASLPRFTEGEALARKAIELDPKFAEAWAELARAQSAFFQFGFDQTPVLIARTIEAVETARRLSPDSPDVLLADAEVYYRLGRDYARARADLERVLQLQPGTAEVYTLLGVVQRRQGQWSEALASTLKAVEIEPRSVQGWQNVRNSYAFARRFDEEKAAFLRLAELDSGNEASGRAALVGLRAGRSADDFRAWLKRLSPVELDSPEATLLRSWGATLLGDYDEVIRLGSTEPNRGNLLPLAWALAAKGDLPAARARLEPALIETRQRLETESANAALWSRLGQIEAVLGHADEARRAVEKAVAMTPDARDAIDGPTFRHDRAVVRAWTGDPPESIAELGRLLRVPGAQTSTNTPLTVAALRRDPRYAPLWGDPRFEALLKEPKNNAPLF